jgi:ubiquinone biosynthesis protein UbiJ
MRAKDYIGTKIAMGRATVEEYAEEIAESERMAARKNELNAMLKEMDEAEAE